MTPTSGRDERSVVLFLLAALAFNPPILLIFGVDRFVFGVPLIYLYLFVAWAIVIALIARTANKSNDHPERALPGVLEGKADDEAEG